MRQSLDDGKTCGDCKCFVPTKTNALQLGDAPKGECRATSPSATSFVTDGRQVKLTGYPIVKEGDKGCFGFLPKEETDEYLGSS